MNIFFMLGFTIVILGISLLKKDNKVHYIVAIFAFALGIILGAIYQ